MIMTPLNTSLSAYILLRNSSGKSNPYLAASYLDLYSSLILILTNTKYPMLKRSPGGSGIPGSPETEAGGSLC